METVTLILTGSIRTKDPISQEKIKLARAKMKSLRRAINLSHNNKKQNQ